jgi:hypothetical protein
LNIVSKTCYWFIADAIDLNLFGSKDRGSILQRRIIPIKVKRRSSVGSET